MTELARLLLQIAVILAAIRPVGWVFRKLRQPQVIGEMIAGILLGPSVLGALWPTAFTAIFPERSLGSLGTLSQIGLVLFLFLVGLHHDPSKLKGHTGTAVIASHASILVPFLFGSALALLFYPRLSDDSVTFTEFALFMGTAMSITAFPVLARILEDRDLLHTTVGSTAIVCAAVDDLTGWLVVAAVLLLVHAQGSTFPLWIGAPLALAYAAFMLTGARRLLGWIATSFHRRGRLTHEVCGLVFLIVFASAWVTERLGIHPLFGAFMAGVAMPKDKAFVEALTGKLEDVAIVLLLPLFFVFSGLRTRIGSLTGADLCFYFPAILATAIVGKVSGAALAGKATGLTWREATSLGVLVNTRGLVELVVLNIGLDAGIISRSVFTIMVLVAITTTLMTTPLVDVIYPPRLRTRDAAVSS